MTAPDYLRQRRRFLVAIVAPLVLLVTVGIFFAWHAARLGQTSAPALPVPSVPAVPVPEDDLKGGTAGIAYGAGLEGMAAAEQVRQLDDMRSLGVRWLRIDLPWSVVQAGSPNSWNWSLFDTTVPLITSRGIQPVLILDFAPGWARSKACAKDQRCAPAKPADFARFAAAAAARYARYGAHVY